MPNLARSVRSRSALPWRPGAWLIAALAPLLWLGLAAAQTSPPDDLAPMERQTTEADPAQLLDESLLGNAEQFAAARTRADAAPPETQDAAALARFYFQRGRAADLVGRRLQSLRDLRQAANFARQGDLPDRGQIFFVLAPLEANHVSLRRAIDLIEEAIRSTPKNHRGRLVSYYARQATLQVRVGDVAAADAAIENAAATFRSLGEMRNASDPAAMKRSLRRQIMSARAAVQELRGHFQKADEVRREIIKELESETEPNIRSIAQQRRALAHNLARQGRLADAENEARAALAMIQKKYGTASVETANSLDTLAEVLNDAGRHFEAEALVRKGMDLLRATGLSARGNVRQLLGAILAAEGRWNEAVVEFDGLKKFYERDPDSFEAAVGPSSTYPLVLLKVGRTDEAVPRLTRMVDERRRTMGERHYITAEARGFLGMALAATGQTEKALAEFAAAMPILLDRARTSDDDAATLPEGEQRLRLIAESYIELLVDSRGTPLAGKLGFDPMAASFRLADAVRGRSVVRAVAAVAARAAANDPALAELVRTAQDAEKEASAVNGLLANAISARADERDAATIKTLQAQIDELRQRRDKAMAEVERRAPEFARLVDPKPATLQSARAALRPGEAVIAFYSTERRTFVWAVPQAGEIAFAAAPLGRDELAKSVQKLRQALEPEASSLDGLPVFDLAEAWRLYAALLQPVEAGWRQATSLFVVPHAAIAELPLGLLPTAPTTLPKRAAGAAPFSEYRDVPWLIRRTALTQLPSISALATLRALPPGNTARRPFVGFADPWFSRDQATSALRGATPSSTAGTTRGAARPAVALRLRSVPKTRAAYSAELAELPRLPDTAEEVSGIAAALGADPARDLFLGARASDAALRKVDLSSYRVVMFATHGLVPGDLKGLTQPALALSAPDVATDGGSGLLTAESILSLKLDADWVVLSACNTAAASGAGAEAVSGLGRAFFYAGTRAILVSNWPVETTSARSLTTDLFRRQAAEPSLSRAEALRRAMLALIDGPGLVEANGKTTFAYAHPLFWAPFSLVGDAGLPSAGH